MQEVTLTHTHNGEVAIIQFHRQKYRNAINTETARLLLNLVRQFEASQSKVAILYGDTDFCAGFDLKEANNLHYQASEVVREWETTPLGRGPMGPTRLFPSKPIIAAVKGYCVAGGLELACWCDLIVSHPESTFGVFCRKVGVPLIDGGTVRLPKIVGLNRAREMVLTGRAVSGSEAYEWGLVNRLVNQGEVLEESIRLAVSLAGNPQKTMLSDRRSMHESVFGDMQKQLSREFDLGLGSLIGGGSKEGVARFNDRKKTTITSPKL